LSEKPTPWSEITSGLLAVLTAISTYLGTQPLTTLFAVMLGAFVTYTVQKRLQSESEKRTRNVEYVETYYGPLLVEIQKIQDELLNNVSYYSDYNKVLGFKTHPQFYTMGKKLRVDFIDFTDKIVKLNEKIRFYKDKIIDLVCEKGQPHLVNPPGKTVVFNSDKSYSPIYFRYKRESDFFWVFVYDCILQDRNPIDIIKEKAANFQEEYLEIEFSLRVDDNTGHIAIESDQKRYSDRKEIIDQIVSEVTDELNQDQSYNDFRRELNDLRQKTASLSSRLAEYIEEYVSIVDI
jgi:hypothetical protein